MHIELSSCEENLKEASRAPTMLRARVCAMWCREYMHIRRKEEGEEKE